MSWDLTEAVEYYRRQGAPGDQNALKNLLSEMQEGHGGTIPRSLLQAVAEALGTKESFLLAVIRRSPCLRLGDLPVLEICAGPNCGRAVALAKLAEQYRGRAEVKFVPCMRQCGKGPNLRLNGRLYQGADAPMLEKLLRELLP